MPERMTISIDEDIRTRLDAHPEINGSGLFRKAVMELDKGQSPEEILAWKDIEIARINQTNVHHLMQKEMLILHQKMIETQLELQVKQNEIDAITTASKMDITTAKFEVARAKDTIRILQEADLEDGNIYLESLNEISDILTGSDLMVRDTKKVGVRGKHVHGTLTTVLRNSIRKETQGNRGPSFKGPSDIFKDFGSGNFQGTGDSNEEDPDPHSPLWEHAQQIHGLVKDGKTHDEIVQFYKENHPTLWSPREKYVTKSQIRYWYDHFTAKHSEEE